MRHAQIIGRLPATKRRLPSPLRRHLNVSSAINYRPLFIAILSRNLINFINIYVLDGCEVVGIKNEVIRLLIIEQRTS